jgi:hypothetical protein
MNDRNCFKPLKLFERFGMQRVFYKGKAPKQKETEQERALAEVAAQKWARYKDVGVKAENAYMGKVNEMGAEASNQFARGIASSASAAKSNNISPLARIAPATGANSGAAKASQFDNAMAGALSGADNTMGAALSREDQHAGGIQSVVAMGQGQSAEAQSGLTDLAISANRKASQDSIERFNNHAANMNAAGTLVGGGLQAAYGDDLALRHEKRLEAKRKGYGLAAGDNAGKFGGIS